jgi:hypothetical protein
VAEQHVERRLAAILAADIVGYSRLTGVDEEGTLAKRSSDTLGATPRGKTPLRRTSVVGTARCRVWNRMSADEVRAVVHLTLPNSRVWHFWDMAGDLTEGRFRPRNGHPCSGRSKPVCEFTAWANFV